MGDVYRRRHWLDPDSKGRLAGIQCSGGWKDKQMMDFWCIIQAVKAVVVYFDFDCRRPVARAGSYRVRSGESRGILESWSNSGDGVSTSTSVYLSLSCGSCFGERLKKPSTRTRSPND